MRNALINGDCIEVMRSLDADSIDAIVTDPPYGLEFMGKDWDGWDTPHAFGEWCRQWATEALRILKPGGHLLAFGGTRTYHRLVSGIEDAGFEIRDTIAWLYGSGFPKSLDVSKAIDKAAGAGREVVGSKLGQPGYSLARGKASLVDFGPQSGDPEAECAITAPATDAARYWSGFGTALKPAHEPIVVARKPLIGTVAQNVQAHGTGALNIDGCRVGTDVETWPKTRSYAPGQMQPGHVGATQSTDEAPPGRWPANVAHDGSPEVLELFPDVKTGVTVRGKGSTGAKHGIYGKGMGAFPPGSPNVTFNDTGGSAARFFYCAKASRADREAGLVGLPERVVSVWGGDEDDLHPEKSSTIPRRNDHPTVKPHDLMRWLCRLVGGQPGSLILDPFAGSGSTLRAAQAEGFDFLGIERDRHYYRLASLRAGLPDPGETDEEMC